MPLFRLQIGKPWPKKRRPFTANLQEDITANSTETRKNGPTTAIAGPSLKSPSKLQRRKFSMSQVKLVDPVSSSVSVKPTLDKINGAVGAVPNMFKAVANSPAALNSMWGAFGALAGGKLGARLGEEIAVAIANANSCEYCLAAHTVLGQKAGASSDQMAAAQVGQSSDPRTQAALSFALKVVKNRAAVTDADVAALKAAGFDDEGVVEIMAHVALNLFTNYINVALKVPVDFPNVPLKPVV
jgi:uncharacterized peroxidase-related enzyme